MGFSFNFFGKTEIRKFNYRPRFYDPDEEARKEKFGDHAAPKEYVPGEILRYKCQCYCPGSVLPEVRRDRSDYRSPEDHTRIQSPVHRRKLSVLQ